MKIINKFRDIAALTTWAFIFTKASWITFILVSTILFSLFILPKLEGSNTISYYFFKSVGGFGAMSMLLIVISAPLALIPMVVNLFIKGALGEKTIEISNEGISENDGRRITSVRWKDVKSINFTKKYLFIKLTRTKYFIIPARDFDTYPNYAKYYAQMLQYKYG